jgi:hypothetical protein
MTPESREELVRRADEVRGRLVHAVVRLNERRQAVADVPGRIDRSVHRLGPAIAATLTAVAIASVAVGRFVASRSRRRRRLLGGWRRPERETRPSAVGQIVRSLLVTAVTSVLSVPIRWAASALEGAVQGALRSPRSQRPDSASHP